MLRKVATHFGSSVPVPLVAHKPQPRVPGPPQFRLAFASVPSIQFQPRFTDVAVLDCDAPVQRLSPDTVREKAYKPLFIDALPTVNRCEFIGQAVIALSQLSAVVPLTFKHDAWPSEPSLSL